MDLGYATEECTKCHGSGIENAETCRRCKGAKYVKWLKYLYRRCTVCRGKGIVSKSCTLCEGTGQTKVLGRMGSVQKHLGML